MNIPLRGNQRNSAFIHFNIPQNVHHSICMEFMLQKGLVAEGATVTGPLLALIY